MKLTFSKAEHLKRNAAKSPELASILRALKPVLTDFVGEVQRSLGYFTNTHRDAQIEYMVGLGSAFKLPGLQKYLGDKLQLEIRRPTHINRLVGEEVTGNAVFTDNLLTFPVAIGLGLQGLGVSRLHTNLLPPEISFDRKIRAKKPWAVAAAAMLLLGTSVVAVGYSVPYNASLDKRIPDALKKGDDAKKTADGVINDIKSEEKKEGEALARVKALVAGSEERENWVALEAYVNRSLPIPGPGGNVDPSWWSRDEAKEATRIYLDRLQNGLNLKDLTLQDDKRQYLPAIDLQSIHAKPVPDLEAIYTYAAKWCEIHKGYVFRGMSEEEKTHLPLKTPGWIVEIRGSTFYSKDRTPEAFLEEVFLPKLREQARVPSDPLKPKDDPIVDKVSHIFLVGDWKDDKPTRNDFKCIKVSLIDYWVNAVFPGGSYRPVPPIGGPSPGATPPPVTPGRVPRTPGTKYGGVPTPPKPKPADASGLFKNSPYDRQTGQTTTETEKKDPKAPVINPRYEFVIVFAWRELTPSDPFLTPAPPPPKPVAPGTPVAPVTPTPAPALLQRKQSKEPVPDASRSLWVPPLPSAGEG